MKTIFRLLCGWMAIALTTACSHEELLQTEPVQKPAEGKMVSVKAYTPSEQPASRLAFDDQGTEGLKLSWSEGDAFTAVVGNDKVTFTYDANTKKFSGTLPDGATLTDGVNAYYPAYTDEYVKDFSTQTGALNSATTYMEGAYDATAQAFRFTHSTAILKVAFSGLPQNAEIESISIVGAGGDITISNPNATINKDAVYINLPALAKDSKLVFYVETTAGLYTATKTVAAEEGIKVGVYYNTTVALQEACLLPTGSAFYDAIRAVDGYENATSIVFEANVADETPATRSDSNYTIALAGKVLTISTPLSEFVFNKDCSRMFYNLTKIQSIDFGNCVNTSNVTKMDGMFSYCKNLTLLDLNNFNTANVTIMGNMFNNCSALESLNLSSFNTEKVINMFFMFKDCSSLESLNVSSFNTANVMFMNHMFNNCSSLTSLDLSSFNTSNVTDMYYMFNTCSALESLNLSSFNTEKVTNMFYMFQDCSSLTSLDLSSFNTSNVTKMYNMFDGCSKLTSLDLSNFDFSQVTDFTNMFDDLGNSAENKPIPVYVTMAGYNVLSNESTTGIDNSSAQLVAPCELPTGSAFNAAIKAVNGYSDVTSIVFEANSTESGGTQIGSSTAYAKVDGTTLKIYTAANEFVFNASCYEMFDGLSTITAINFNSCVNTAEVTSMGSIFYGCSALTSLNLSGFNTSNVTNMGSMFSGCSALTSLDLSMFNTSNVTNMGAMFYKCSSLESLNLSSFNTEKVEYMNSMFYDCKKLSSLNVSSFNTSNVTAMSNMFEGCERLVSLDVSSFNTEKVTSMYNMFSDCYSLTLLDLSSFDFSQVTDFGDMFDYLGSSATNTPIPIYVTQAGYDILKDKNTYYTYRYFQYVDKDGNPY